MSEDRDGVIRIVIVDDHPVVRDGLRGMFASAPEFEVVGEAGDGAEALTVIEDVDPDVALLDLRMPKMAGVETITELTRRRSRCHVLVLTTYDTDTDTLPAVEAGATGYLLKDTPRDELFAAVRAAAQGQSVLSPTVAKRVLTQMRRPTTEPVSDREIEVLERVARGMPNRDIAAELFISEATVKTHLAHIYDKLDVTDRASAVATAYDRQILGRRG